MDLPRQKLEPVACNEKPAPSADREKGLEDLQVPLTLRERMENWGSD